MLEMNQPQEPTAAAVLEKAQAVFHKNPALQLATAGEPTGDYSPWILGAYFVHDGADLLLFLESEGKSFRNITANPRVAFTVSENDAMKDFVQGRGDARVLPASECDDVMRRITDKLPWFKLYTPVTAVRLVVRELLVSSFASQWFPAKRWAR